MPDIRLADRLLVEWVCRREETAGHPDDCPEADQAAIRAGGDLAARIAVRARALPGSAAQLARIRHLLRAAGVLSALLIGLATVAGIASASAALGASTPASLPLVLLVVVGANLLTLLLWLLLQAARRRIAPGLGALVQTLAASWTRRFDTATDTGMALDELPDPGLGGWSAAVVVHAAWLGFALGAMLALTVLLSARAYDLSWETTLLDDDALGTWARTLSFGPALLGIAGADVLPVTEAGAARQGWSLWLLAASFVYGVAPRALALAVCALMLWHRQRTLGRDLARPGLARLRARLIPDHAELGVVDPAPTQPAMADPPHAAIAAAGLRGRVHGLALEDIGNDAPPALADVDWVWLGTIDDAGSRERVLGRLRGDAVDALAIRVRATLTPDRGIERFVAELAAAARAPTTLLLQGLERLHARGEAAHARRLDDWAALAQRSGVALQSDEVRPA
jgi:hypothetical protein